MKMETPYNTREERNYSKGVMRYVRKIPYAKEGLVGLALLAVPVLSGCASRKCGGANSFSEWYKNVEREIHQDEVERKVKCMNNPNSPECSVEGFRNEQGGGDNGSGGVGGGDSGGVGNIFDYINLKNFFAHNDRGAGPMSKLESDYLNKIYLNQMVAVATQRHYQIK